MYGIKLINRPINEKIYPDYIISWRMTLLRELDQMETIRRFKRNKNILPSSKEYHYDDNSR